MLKILNKAGLFIWFYMIQWSEIQKGLDIPLFPLLIIVIIFLQGWLHIGSMKHIITQYFDSIPCNGISIYQLLCS